MSRGTENSMVRRTLVSRARRLSAATLRRVRGGRGADTGDTIAPQNSPPTAADGWQAGTCNRPSPNARRQTPGQFFTQAAGHPPVGFTQFIVKHRRSSKALPRTPIARR